MAIKKKKHPTFARPNYGRTSRARIKDNWRRPRGVDNKQREKIKYAGCCPTIGWRSPKAIRDMHPCGKRMVRVENMRELENASKDCVLIFASSIGAKKKALLLSKAKQLKLKVLNDSN
ncbi:MAG: eL32 family ribosomal protein [Candidatus Micrarchaeota archaeon]